MDEQVLLSTIIAAPDDDRPRLAYADWLDERGRRDRARLIRVQIELARLPRSEGEPTALEVEEEQLEAVCAESMPRLDGIEWGGFYRGLVESVFPDTPASFRRHAGSIAGVGSVYRVAFDTLDDFAVLAEVPVLRRFTDLSCYVDGSEYLRNGDPNHRFNADIGKVFESPNCPRLRRLSLHGCQVGPSGAKALADCPRLDSLTSLDLMDNYIGDEGMAALAASPNLAALRSLVVALNDLGPTGVEALAMSESLGGLENLYLGESGTKMIGPAAGLALGRSPHLTRLRRLKIHDDIGATGAAALAQAPNLAGLTDLDITCVIDAEGVQALAASPYLRRLKTLYLVWIGDEGAKALARSPVLDSLEELWLQGSGMTDEGARALAASPYLTRLKPGELELGARNDFTEEGWQLLRARFGDRIRTRSEAIECKGDCQG